MENVENYHRWFYIDMGSRGKGDGMIDLISNGNLQNSAWIDGLQRKVKLRSLALKKIVYFCNELSAQEHNIPTEVHMMMDMMYNTNRVFGTNDCDLNDENKSYLSFAMEKLLHIEDEYRKHHPIPVFSYIKPSNSVQFFHHILLSMGNFSIEIDQTMHASIRECFRHAGLIGDGTTTELQAYSNELLYDYIKIQVRYFPNSMRAIDSFIITAGIIFDQAIVHEEVAVTDMSAVQFSNWLKSS